MQGANCELLEDREIIALVKENGDENEDKIKLEAFRENGKI